MTPQQILLILWIHCFAGGPMVRTDFSPYDGPLAERLITERVPQFSANFEFPSNTPELRAFERWLRKHPIHVRAPGHRYIGWGLRTFPGEPGEIMVVRFNLLLTPEEQPFGSWRGNAGDMLTWAFSVLDHYALHYDPMEDHWRETRDQLIASYGSDLAPIDWHAVAERLRSTGRPVPDDLFDQPTR
ncbi:MAG: hypothetical protein R3F65_27490 [bacterium]